MFIDIFRYRAILPILLSIFIFCGCSKKSTDEWSTFMGDVLSSAKEKNYERMVKEFTIYKVSEGKELLKKMAAADPEIHMEPNDNEPTDQQGFDVMIEDVKMFHRSYEDLFDGKPARYSSRRHDIKGVEIYSIILWVKKNNIYKGILIYQVWKKGNKFRVMQWIDSGPSYMNFGTSSRKRAILESRNPESCKFPDSIEYKTNYNQ